jgi:hypothetical protein
MVGHLVTEADERALSKSLGPIDYAIQCIDECDLSGERQMLRESLLAARNALSSTNGDDGELIAALNRKHQVYSGASNVEGDGIKLEPEIVLINPDGPRAANRIASLNASNEIFRKGIEKQAAENERLLKHNLELVGDKHDLNAQLERMREALQVARDRLAIDAIHIASIDAALNQDKGGGE